MAAANSDKFKKVASNTGWQLDASGISDASVDSFGLVNATGLPTGTGVKITVDRVDSSGAKTPSKMERIDGVVDGINIISCVRGVEGTAQAHAGGAVVEIAISADLWNDVMDGILAEHNQDGTHKNSVATEIHAATEKATPVDADELGLVDSAASWVVKKLTIAALKLAILAGFKPADGFTWNIKIVPSVASNNLTVAIKGKDGNDLSASNPGYVMIGGVWRSITGALTGTWNSGQNYLDLGSSRFAAIETDLFVHFVWWSGDSSIKMFVSRKPLINLLSETTYSSTVENGLLPTAGISSATTDVCVNIGRFAATLSAGAGYTWSVPTFTNINLIQKPIYESRWLTYAPTITWTGGVAPTTLTNSVYRYRVRMKECSVILGGIYSGNGTTITKVSATTPFEPAQADYVFASGTISNAFAPVATMIQFTTNEDYGMWCPSSTVNRYGIQITHEI